MFHSKYYLAIALIFVFFVGCGGNPYILDHEFEQPGDPNNPSSTHALGVKSDEWFCFLTKVSGRFRGLGEQVKLYTDSNGNWFLHLQSSQHTVSAKATCTPWYTFEMDSTGSASIDHAELENNDDESTYCYAKEKLIVNTGTPKPMCFVSGISGLFASKDERVLINETTLYTHRCEDGQMTVNGTCANTGFDQQSGGAYLVGGSNPYAVDLMKVEFGYCAIRQIQGKLERDTFVEIVRVNGWWKLIGNPGIVSGEDKLKAAAQCFRW